MHCANCQNCWGISANLDQKIKMSCARLKAITFFTSEFASGIYTHIDNQNSIWIFTLWIFHTFPSGRLSPLLLNSFAPLFFRVVALSCHSSLWSHEFSIRLAWRNCWKGRGNFRWALNLPRGVSQRKSPISNGVLLHRKLLRSTISSCFPETTGANDYFIALSKQVLIFRLPSFPWDKRGVKSFPLACTWN